jgi:hypothetical protein
MQQYPYPSSFHDTLERTSMYLANEPPAKIERPLKSEMKLSSFAIEIFDILRAQLEEAFSETVLVICDRRVCVLKHAPSGIYKTQVGKEVFA